MSKHLMPEMKLIANLLWLPKIHKKKCAKGIDQLPYCVGEFIHVENLCADTFYRFQFDFKLNFRRRNSKEKGNNFKTKPTHKTQTTT